MAIETLNVFLEDGTTKTTLNETFNEVVDEIGRKAVSVALKDNTGVGNAESGTYVFDMYTNSNVQAYGTARSAGKGNALKTRRVIVNLEEDIEIVEEYEAVDAVMGNFKKIAGKLKDKHKNALVRELDKAFFAQAIEEGTASTLAGVTLENIEALIGEACGISTDLIDGQDREDLALVLSTKAYSKLRSEIDALPTTDNTLSNGKVGRLHGVEVYETNHLPATADVMIMRKGAVAQPFYSKAYEADRIPLSNAFAVQLFAKYGTKVILPETIKYIEAVPSV